MGGRRRIPIYSTAHCRRNTNNWKRDHASSAEFDNNPFKHFSDEGERSTGAQYELSSFEERMTFLNFRTAINRNNVEELKRLIATNTNENMFNYEGDQCETLLAFAIRKRSIECVLCLLRNRPDDVLHRSPRTGRLPIYSAIEVAHHHMVQQIITKGYKLSTKFNELKYKESRRVLMKLLVHGQFESFDLFVSELELDLSIFFRSVMFFHYPYHELCALGQDRVVAKLGDKYSKEMLNIKGEHCDLLPICRSGCIQEMKCFFSATKPYVWNTMMEIVPAIEIRETTKIDSEEEIVWSLMSEVSSSASINILTDLLKRNWLSQKALEFDESGSEGSYCLRLAYMKCRENCIDRIEELLFEEYKSQRITRTTSLKYAVLYMHDNSKRIYELVEKNANVLEPYVGTVDYVTPIFYMCAVPRLWQTVSYVYTQCKNIPTNEEYNVDGVQKSLFRQASDRYLASPSARVFYTVSILYSAGEHYSDDEISDSKIVKLEICPYRDLEEQYPPVHTTSHVPRLTEICRATIRNTASCNRPRENLFDIFAQLASRKLFPSALCKYLVYDLSE